ncbi:cell wall hydrolase [Bacillus sp. EB01]|uniref:cell wall hydrolase n=1 Tax=Bacillus sp. EB01 TaxID=1347086 RepID=UPI00069422B0|nr:cell wall hydrolase [Bacillus sp. EB01]
MQKPASLLLMPAMLLMLAIPGSLSAKSITQEKNGSTFEPAKERKINIVQKDTPIKNQPKEDGPQLTKEEKELLARLVHAEAKGEPFKGKVAVAEVVLNRVEDGQFPDTVKEVIYQKRQFDPVANGEINKPAGNEAKEAVEEALAPDEKVTEALFFYNPEIATDTWIRTRPVIEKIGEHNFSI